MCPGFSSQSMASKHISGEVGEANTSPVDNARSENDRDPSEPPKFAGVQADPGQNVRTSFACPAGCDTWRLEYATHMHLNTTNAAQMSSQEWLSSCQSQLGKSAIKNANEPGRRIRRRNLHCHSQITGASQSRPRQLAPKMKRSAADPNVRPELHLGIPPTSMPPPCRPLWSSRQGNTRSDLRPRLDVVVGRRWVVSCDERHSDALHHVPCPRSFPHPDLKKWRSRAGERSKFDRSKQEEEEEEQNAHQIKLERIRDGGDPLAVWGCSDAVQVGGEGSEDSCLHSNIAVLVLNVLFLHNCNL